MSPVPLTSEAIRALSDERCNTAEIAAYTGLPERAIRERLQKALEASEAPAAIIGMSSVRQIQAEWGVSRATAYRWKRTHAALLRRPPGWTV